MATGLVIVVALYLTLFYRLEPASSGDPDRYFHLAIAREVASHGIVDKLPQAEDVGWGRGYPNGYFLFSLFTGAAYRLAGASGALGVPPLLAILLLISIYAFACRWVRPGLAAWIVLLGLLCPDFATRLTVLRPHLLAVLFGTWLTIAAYYRKTFWVALLSALFALTYHAFYVPILLVGAMTAVELALRRRLPAMFWASLVGVGLGIVVNPTFPLHLRMLRVSLGAAFGVAVDASEASAETLPLTAAALVSAFGFFLLFLSVGSRDLWRSRSAMREHAAPLGLIAAAFVLWGLCLISARSAEYALPVSLLAIPVLVASHRSRSAVTSFLWFLPVILILPTSAVYLKAVARLPVFLEREALARIPASAAGKKIFNCDWQSGAYILHDRPDLRFVDLLDAHYLATEKPAAHAARLALKSGGTSYAYGVIRYLFGSDYVLCRHPSLISQFESDPHFRRLFPDHPVTQTSPGPYVYELAERPLPNFLTRYEAALLPITDNREYARLLPTGDRAWRPVASHPAFEQPLADLLGWRNAQGAAAMRNGFTDVVCTAVRPAPAMLKNFVGATAIGVGGGPRIRLWWNDTPLYVSHRSPDLPRLVNDYVGLPRPWRETDRLAAVVCSRGDFQYSGFALSFWRDGDLRKLCEQREARNRIAQDGLSWKYLGNGSDGCQAMAPHPRLFD